MDEQEKNINSWKSFYKNMSTILFEFNPRQFRQIIERHYYIYEGHSIERDAYKIDNFYIYTNLSAELILLRLRLFIREIGLDLDDVVFTIS